MQRSQGSCKELWKQRMTGGISGHIARSLLLKLLVILKKGKKEGKGKLSLHRKINSRCTIDVNVKHRKTIKNFKRECIDIFLISGSGRDSSLTKWENHKVKRLVNSNSSK